ncbi:MAG TPA: BON domain-containing protein [Bryobacteraceae bacterium]|nr:BON domain-containing protein [Bryobacteraceae bacterium]
MNRICAVFCLLAASFTLPGRTPTKSHSEGKFSDAEIEATIKAKLEKSKIGKDGFQVHVKDRVATWTGTTSVMQHKGAATRMAKAAGALRVTNNIKIVGEDAAKVKGNLGGQPRHVQVKPGAPSETSPSR